MRGMFMTLAVIPIHLAQHTSAPVSGGGSGLGDGLFLASEDFGRMFDNSFPACTFFLKWRLARTH